MREGIGEGAMAHDSDDAVDWHQGKRGVDGLGWRWNEKIFARVVYAVEFELWKGAFRTCLQEITSIDWVVE